MQKTAGRICVGATLLFAALGLSSALGASGVYTNGVGARSMALGGADVAFPEGPLSALGINPAGFTLLQCPTFDIGIIGAVPSGDFTSKEGRSSGLQTGFRTGPEMAFGMPAGSSPVSFGIGVIPVSGLAAHWRYLDPRGGADGKTTYGVQMDNADVSLLRPAAGVSISLCPWFAIGGSVGASYNENLLQTPYIFQTQRALQGIKTLLDLQTNGWGLNGSAGVLIRPTCDFQIGLSYQTPTQVDSRGSASGNVGAQLDSLGGAFAAARRDFHYDAEVDTQFPQMISGGISWKFCPRWRLALQADWINWSSAFDVLPVKLTGGNNKDINGLVGDNRLQDDVPLRWRDQVVGRAGVEYALTEAWFLRAGYAYGRSPVPSSTLTPMTAVLPEHTLTAGAGYRWRWLQVDLAYQWDIPASRSVGRSDLLDGEYSNSNTRVSIHLVGLTTSIHF